MCELEIGEGEGETDGEEELFGEAIGPGPRSEGSGLRKGREA